MVFTHLLARLHLAGLILVVFPEIHKPISFELLDDDASLPRELCGDRVSVLDKCFMSGYE